MSRFNGFKESVAELFTVEDDVTPKGSERRASTEIYSGDYERKDAPKDAMQKYWRHYETFPIVRESISSFAREVVEPGWYIECDSEKTAKELTEWFEEAAIIEGETDKDSRLLMRKVIVQREVRGTSLVEKVRGKDTGKIVALYIHNPEEFEAYTYPRTNILLDKDADVDLPEDIPKTSDGDIPAYVQFDTSVSRWERRRESGKAVDIPFTKDEILKFTRDADANEVFGTSRLESVSERIEAMQNKLQDNDSAIASKAYPFWLFKFGSEDNPWEREDVKDFMEHHDLKNFKPQMKQGVAGDVNIDTISGETADLEHAIETDVDLISTAMPVPRFQLGGFAEKVNQFTASAQENAMRRQVREARKELQEELTPLLREVAEERDLDSADTVELKIGDPTRPEIPQDGNQNVMRYVSDSPGGQKQQNPQQGKQKPSSPKDAGQKDPRESAPDGSGKVSNSQESERSVWDVEVEETAELAQSGMPNVEQEQDTLQSEASDALREARERAMTRVGKKYDRNSQSMNSTQAQSANAAISTAISEAGLQTVAAQQMMDALRKEIESLASGGPVALDVTFGIRHRQQARHYAQNYENAVREAADDMFEQMRRQIRRGVERGESWETVSERIKNEFSSQHIAQRASLIARMELQNAVQSTRLRAFEASKRVVGYKVINVCGPSTTPLCEELAGCGSHETAKVWFDSGLSPSEQLENQIGTDAYRGFSPVPSAPPFHFNCRSSIVPIPASDDE